MHFISIIFCFIGGTTIHTGLGFKFGCNQYLPLRNAKLEEMRTNFEELEIIIMDEFSMISSDHLYNVHRRMEEIMMSKDAFGGRSILLFGDIMQLPPVRAIPIYSKPKSQKNRSLFNSSENLWNNFEVVTLKKNFRQGVSKLRQCLDRIRIGELSDEDIELLETRRLSKFPNLDTNEASHVFYTNLEVDNHNARRLNSLKTDLVEIEARGMYPKGYRPVIDANGMIENTPFQKKLCLKIGARVMVTFNVSLSDSLVNGVLGTILDFVYDDQSMLKAVIIVFDNEEVGQMQMKDHEVDCSRFKEQNGCPIYRTTLEHTLKKNGAAKGKTTQFPLRLAWANTCHKLQGVTIKKGSDLVIHGHPRIPKNMFYVMLSRCSSLENLYLDNEVDLSKVLCDPGALKEKQRLDEKSIGLTLNIESYDIYYINIRSLGKHEPDLLNDPFAKSSTCICLVETWLDPTTPFQHGVPDKTLVEASSGHGKGSCAFLPQGTKTVGTVCQSLFQIVSFVYKDLQVSVLYISKDADKSQVKESLEKLFLPSFNKLVIGDFNFDTQSNNALVTFMKKSNLVQIVQQPTHQEGRTIDHIYVSSNVKNRINFKVVFKYFTDHAALQIKIT